MKRTMLKYIPAVLITIWVLFTVSLATWWFIFSARQAERLSEIAHDSSAELVRHQRMLLWEGGTLIVSLLLGGGALGYLARREMQQGQALKEFFATFSHELKTPIASVRLQAQRLREKLDGEVAEKKGLERLVRESNRLALQLENALFLSSGEDRKLFIEQIRLNDLISVLDDSELRLIVRGDCILDADRRALESIFGNLVRNARIHGGASEVRISVENEARGLVKISVHDNGSGYQGPLDKLGKLYYRAGRMGGNGIGLYLVQTLAAAMKGRAEFASPSRGFLVDIWLPGRITSDARDTAG